MTNRIYSVIFTLSLLTPPVANSQTTTAKPFTINDWRFKKHSVYAEFLGPGLLATFNYELLIKSFNVRIGLGVTPGGVSSISAGTTDAYQLTFPIMAGYLIGLGQREKSLAIELGAGAVLSWNPSADQGIWVYEPGFGVAGTAAIGGRYLFGNGMTARVAYTPVFGNKFYENMIGVAVGGAFGGPRAPDQCHEISSCDVMTGKCQYKYKPDGTNCNDNNRCTDNDQCQSGVCLGAKFTCEPAGACNVAAGCDPSRGCVYTALPEGTACNDGNACSVGDQCRAGKCMGSVPQCPAEDQCNYSVNACDGTTGCIRRVKANGTVCDDGNVCSQNDICQQGVCGGSFSIDASERCLMDLANRFRPYLKFSKDKGKPEPHHPVSWQTLFNQSTLKYNNLSLNAWDSLSYSDVRRPNSCSNDTKLTFIKDASLYGAPWLNVLDGEGIYSHVSQLGNGVYVIEYWILFPYNRVNVDCNVHDCGFWDWIRWPSWCADQKITEEFCEHVVNDMMHEYDLTNVVLVYNAINDQVKKVMFPQHGCSSMTFEFPAGLPGAQWKSVHLPADRGIIDNGIDGGKLDTNVIELAAPTTWSVSNHCPFIYGFIHSEPVLYLVKDPDTGRHEHPVLFIEWGTHENWPNPTGGFWVVPSHKGDDVSFLPHKVKLLRISGDSTDGPFLFFGGRYGDPGGIMRHRGWCDSAQSVGASCGLFDWPDPYADPALAVCRANKSPPDKAELEFKCGPGELYCHDTGKCYQENLEHCGECRFDWDCGPNHVCKFNKCVRFCKSDKDCNNGSLCSNQKCRRTTF